MYDHKLLLVTLVLGKRWGDSVDGIEQLAF